MNSRTYPSETDVVIIGAGPVGLALSLALGRYGVDHVLVDKRPGPWHTSRSFTLHARTLEQLQLLDESLVTHFLSFGVKTRGFLFNFAGLDHQPCLDLSSLPTKFPFFLSLGQGDIEEAFLSSLQRPPIWNATATAFETDEHGARVIVHMYGADVTISTKFIVGCDGHKSFVRSSLDIPFVGDKYENLELRMTDAPLHNFCPKIDVVDESARDTNWVNYYMSRDSFLFITRLGCLHPESDEQMYRILISKMSDSQAQKFGELQSFDTAREVVQSEVSLHLGGDVKVGKPIWATIWELWRQSSSAYRGGHGRVFLAGDAAHVHSPTGGQGMNVGLQDAFNLAWKLAFVLQGVVVGDESEEKLLASYEDERLPVGHQVLDGTHRMHDVIMAHGKGMADRLEITRQPGWHLETMSRISGLSYNYAKEGNKDGIVGYRFDPNTVVVSEPEELRLVDIMERLNKVRCIALVPIGPETRTEALGRVKQVIGRFAHVVEASPKTSGVQKDHVLVLRPDGYCLMNCRVDEIEDVATGIF